jgi:N-acetylmuramoyl-L-alanine amidase
MRKSIVSQLSLVIGGLGLWGGLALAATPQLVVNGRVIQTTPGIVVEEGTSYGPLRATAEAVGAEVTWYEEQQMAVICRSEQCVRIWASEGIVRENRLLLPIRNLAESLGGTVQWVDSPPQVRITIK